jgi:purine nucleosidase
VPLYLDCDPGIDDALALGYLLGHPDSDLVGIGTVSGNTDARTAARNALDLLALFGRPSIPVAAGSVDFLERPYAGGAPHVHGERGLGAVELPDAGTAPVEEDAAGMLIRLAAEHPGELRVLAIGPLTNLALALDRDPGLASRVRDVTIMGGAALAPGNVTAVAEANIHNDPEAAARVLAADWDVTLVPLDVTMEHRLELDDLAALADADRPAPRALGAMLDFYSAFYATRFGRRLSVLHDPLAAGILLGEAVPTRALRMPVHVDTSAGPHRGRTTADLRDVYAADPSEDPAGVRVVLEVADDFAPALVARLLAVGPA